jgi:chitinase
MCSARVQIAGSGHRHFRFTQTFAAGERRTLTVTLPENFASASTGAVASGDGTRHGALIDETEATNWERTGAQPSVAGSTIVVDLSESARRFDRVQVSVMLLARQNRFTALR